MESFEYECHFTGRLVGAIGIIGKQYAKVVSNKRLTMNQVRLDLYKTYEHISDLRITCPETLQVWRDNDRSTV